MDRTATRPVGLAIALAAMLGPVEARPSWASGTFVYTDVCVTAEHEPAGQRVILRRSPRGDTLVYEAALSGPVRVETLRLEAATGALAFEAEADGHPIRFTGTLAVDALTGVLEDEAGPHPVRLPRILRPHADPACRDTRTGALGPQR